MQTSIYKELVSHLKTVITGADIADLVKFQNYITKEQRTALLGDSIHSSVLFVKEGIEIIC